MEIKKRNEAVALAIVVLISVASFLLIYLFYSIISPVELKKDSTKNSLEIKDNILEKITGENSNSSVLLEDNNLGRENPFGELN